MGISHIHVAHKKHGPRSNAVVLESRGDSTSSASSGPFPYPAICSFFA